ncbi:MAG: DnaD domain protein [Lachnospiraceae bacterium]|nr:DnaD domain protein [Lachnospiraceae bacterium]
MSCFTIYQDNHTDSTVISNRFIDEYMQDANDAQLKIYLYLLRMMSASRATSISDIADLFNYTEKDVMRALKYWEKHHLLTLDLDEHKNVIGIHLRDFNTPSPAASVPIAAQPAALASVVPIASKFNSVESGKQAAAELPQQFLTDSPEQAAEASIDNIYVKPNYTLDELKAFKSDESTARLLFVAEQYLKKTLSATEVKTILFISDRLAFSEDLIDYLIQYCVDRGKKELRYIEKVAVSWAQQGVTTPGQAAKLAGRYDKSVYEIMKALGKNGTPTKTEVAYITRWTKEYGFDTDIIFTACERTVLATDKHRFEYADRILASWQKSGVHSVNDIQSLDEHYHRTKPSRPASGNKFNQFTQNSYDFEALEQELISN